MLPHQKSRVGRPAQIRIGSLLRMRDSHAAFGLIMNTKSFYGAKACGLGANARRWREPRAGGISRQAGTRQHTAGDR